MEPGEAFFFTTTGKGKHSSESSGNRICKLVQSAWYERVRRNFSLDDDVSELAEDKKARSFLRSATVRSIDSLVERKQTRIVEPTIGVILIFEISTATTLPKRAKEVSRFHASSSESCHV